MSDIQVKEISYSFGREAKLVAKVWKKTTDSSNPTLYWLMLHGWIDNASSYDIFAPIFIDELSNYANANYNIELVALENAGHGKSYHRKAGTYHFIDYTADSIHFVEQLGWSNFSVIGHSLGAGVGATLSGTISQIKKINKSCKLAVDRLVIMEALGPSSYETNSSISLARAVIAESKEFNALKSTSTTSTENSNTSPTSSKNSNTSSRLEKDDMQKLVTRQQSSARLYGSVEAAAKRRSEKNVVGKLPMQAAMLLATRGTKKVTIVGNEINDNGNGDADENKINNTNGNDEDEDADENNKNNNTTTSGYKWNHDSGVKLPSRFRFSQRQANSFYSAIDAPVLFVYATDGLFKNMFKIVDPFTKLGYIIFYLIALLAKILNTITFNKISFLSTLVKRLALGMEYANRLQFIKQLQTMKLNHGGHHPHMDPLLAKQIAQRIVSWAFGNQQNVTINKKTE